MKSWYKFEPASADDKSPHFGRVLDAYTNAPIGYLSLGPTRIDRDGVNLLENEDTDTNRLWAMPFLQDDEPEALKGDWSRTGNVHAACKALWKHHRKHIPSTEWLGRYFWRFEKLLWLLLGIILGAVISC